MRLLPMTSTPPVAPSERSQRPPAAGVAPRDRARREAGVGRRPSQFWRIREDVPRRMRLMLVVISLVAPFAVWTLLTATQAVDPLFLPPPIDVLSAAGELLSS